MKFKVILILIGLVLLPLSVAAADYSPATHERFMRLDTNHDGYISQDEAKADSQLSQEWKTVDKDSTGKIDESEFSAFEEDMEPGHTAAEGSD